MRYLWLAIAAVVLAAPDAAAARPGTPTSPTNVNVVLEAERFLVAWEPPLWSGLSPVSGYNVYRLEYGGVRGIGTVGGATREFLDDALAEPDAVIGYLVTAFNTEGEGPMSEPAFAGPLDYPHCDLLMIESATLPPDWLHPGCAFPAPVANAVSWISSSDLLPKM